MCSSCEEHEGRGGLSGGEEGRFLTQAMASLPDATLAIDTRGRVRVWNRAMEKLTGVLAVDMVGKGDYEYALPFYGERRPILADLVLLPEGRLQGMYDLVSKEGDTLTVEIFVPSFGPNGAHLWAKASPLYDSSGNLLGAVESIRDIAERKKTENALQRSEQEKAAILGGLRNVAVEYLDTQMRIIWVNAGVQRFCRKPLEELQGRYCYEVIQGVDRPCPGCKALKTLEGGSSQEGELVTPDGKVWAARSNAIRNEEGETSGVVNVAVNITQIKLAEQKVCSMKKRLAQIIDFLPDATFAIDGDGKVITWNKAMENMTGVLAEDIIGRGGYEHALPFYGVHRPILADLVLMPDEVIEGKYRGLNKEGNNKTLTAEIFIPTFGPQGSFIWAKATPLYDSDGNVAGAIESIRDITEMRRAEETLERNRSELRIASDIQRSFLPERIPSIADFDLAAISVPAMEVGGDFYDFIPGGGGRLGMVIADVSGKSVPAALFMALSRTIVRANATHHERGIEVLQDANDMISADSRSGMFVTLFYGVLDEKERSLIYANAGHPPPLLFRGFSGDFAELEVTGIALGIMCRMEYEERRIDLMPGDVLVMYTDGVTEATNRDIEQYGMDRLRSIVRKAHHLPAQRIMECILDDISGFSSGQAQFDDITMIVVKAE